jgi:Na+-translocating ferredoxin:NAD+ oxidoreductase RnfG subunit
MTSCVLIDTTGAIQQLDILDYNGDRGRKVTNIMWLEQFNGKTASDDFNIGSGVDAISGATISARAVAAAAKRWCLLAHYIIESERQQ